LCKARHVIVTLHGEGALWMERPKKTDKPRFHHIFDTEHMEEEWAVKTKCEGNAYGFHSCFAAAIAADLILVGSEADQIETGITLLLLLTRCEHPGLDLNHRNRCPLPRKASHFSSATRRTFQPAFTNIYLQPVQF
jgi:hypothetical protein